VCRTRNFSIASMSVHLFVFCRFPFGCGGMSRSKFKNVNTDGIHSEIIKRIKDYNYIDSMIILIIQPFKMLFSVFNVVFPLLRTASMMAASISLYCVLKSAASGNKASNSKLIYNKKNTTLKFLR
jgi:hypothetical protein